MDGSSAPVGVTVPEMMGRGERPDLISYRLTVGEKGLAQRSPAPNPCFCYTESSVLAFMVVLPYINPDYTHSSFE